MKPLDRLESALRSAWLPLVLLLLALSTVFVFAGDRGYFYRSEGGHSGISSEHLRIAVNLSLERGFQRFVSRFMDEDGVVRYEPYNRFPPGGYLLVNLAALPASDNLSARLYAARILMLLLFAGAAVLAYLSLSRLASNRWIALTATLLAFSSYYLLYYNDMIAPDGILDFFGVMLTFHGMVVFVQEGRFRQLIVKTCIALLLGWHVLALLLAFVIFGLARDLLRARSAAATSPHPRYVKLKHAATAALRSRYLLLGAVALGFGLSVLTFNFAMEYAALGGETPLTELPSFKALLRRAGVERAPWDYAPFMQEQFSRISRMFIPYSLLGSADVHESPTWLPELWKPAAGVALSVAGLIGSMFVRPRILFAALASFGFFWALPMRNQAEPHDFESIYYIGIPLVLFTLVLLLARRLTNRGGVIAVAAVAALILFATSSFQMGRVGHSAEAAQAARGFEQDLSVIRKLIAGGPVRAHRQSIGWQGSTGRVMKYYLDTIPIGYEDLPAVEGGLVVMRGRIKTPALLTPQNQYIFLYDRDGLEAWYGAAYRSVASTEPLAREEFDVYLIDGEVYYLKEPCDGSNFTARLFLHIFPANIEDLPADRREHGFDNLDFIVLDRGLIFDGKCLARVDLPQYDIAGFRTGRVRDDDVQVWSAAHAIQGPQLISEYQAIVSTDPAARSEFDLYIRGGKLYYVKEPCGRADVQASFFLHVRPEDESNLPDDRREYGFDNLDFGFSERGVVFDSKCMASVDLPRYGIARIVTGQFEGGSRVWEVEVAPVANE